MNIKYDNLFIMRILGLLKKVKIFQFLITLITLISIFQNTTENLVKNINFAFVFISSIFVLVKITIKIFY